ncbi:MAG: type II secretion system F family protein [bacterium]|nr:type II secretion system F family protein [bacterium]
MLYTYSAINPAGQTVTGEFEAENEYDLGMRLKKEELLLLGSARAGRRETTSWLGFFGDVFQKFSRVSLVEKMTFARNLAVMIGAGLSMTKSLEALRDQTENKMFKRIIAKILDGVTQGKNFADGLREFEDVFGVLFINMIASGESSGKLESVLKLLARQMKRDHDIRSKVRGAMIYPAIIVSFLVIVGVMMMVYVVPTLTATFTELGIALPLLTRIIIGISNFLLGFWWLVMLAFLVLIFGLYRALKTAAGKKLFDRIVLKLPIFGPLIQKFNSARMSRTLASLIASGVEITKALHITSSVLGNSLFREAIGNAAEGIQKGKQLNIILKEYPKLFPPLVVQMVGVGEETGTISRMLLRLAIFYEGEVSDTTKNLSSVIEPILMIVIGGVVGLFAVAIMQPIYSGLGGL